MNELEKIFSATQHEFEDWTSNIRSLCRQCSEGIPHAHHDKELEKQLPLKRTLGLAIFNNQNVIPLFDDWQKKTQAKLLTLESDEKP